MTADPYPADWPAWARQNSYVDGDCIIWAGTYVGKKLMPRIELDGERVNVKLHLMWEPGDGWVTHFLSSCRRGRCIAPAHQEWEFIPRGVRPRGGRNGT